MDRWVLGLITDRKECRRKIFKKCKMLSVALRHENWDSAEEYAAELVKLVRYKHEELVYAKVLSQDEMDWISKATRNYYGEIRKIEQARRVLKFTTRGLLDDLIDSVIN